MDTNTIYRSVERIEEKDLIWTPNLGWVPVVVKKEGVLNDEVVKKIAKYTGGPVLSKVYSMAPDKDYVELLRKAGFELEPCVTATNPIMMYIYGNVIEGAWRVSGKGIVANYPPLGYYDDSRDKIFVLDSVSNRLGVIVHENIHYAAKEMDLVKLNDVEETVARFYEVLAEIGVENLIVSVKELPQKLEDGKVIGNLRFIVEALGVKGDIPINKRNEATWLFRKAVGLVEEGELDPRILHRIVRGDACIENFGSTFRIVNC